MRCLGRRYKREELLKGVEIVEGFVELHIDTCIHLSFVVEYFDVRWDAFPFEDAVVFIIDKVA